MSHNSKGRKGKGGRRLPLMQGLPVKDEITEEDLAHIGQRTHAPGDGPSESRFSVPSRAKAIRRAGERQRRDPL